MPVSRPRAPRPDQRHRPHRGRPQHARLGAGQQHEPGHAEDTDQHQPPCPHARPAGQHQQEADHQRQVRAGDRGEVGQAAGRGSPRRPGPTSTGRRRRPGPGPARGRPGRPRPPTPGSRPGPAPRPANSSRAGAAPAGGRPAESTPARSGPSGRASRPVPATTGPERRPAPALVGDHQHRHTGLVAAPPADDLGRPRPGSSTNDPNRPSRSTGSAVTRAVTVTTAPCSASRATGPCRLASTRSAVTPPTAHGREQAGEQRPHRRARAAGGPPTSDRAQHDEDRHGPPRQPEHGQAARPGGHPQDHRPQVGRPVPGGDLDGRQRRHQSVTKGAISASVASPMPDTSSSSSTEVKRAVLAAERQDRPGRHRADPGQQLQVGLGGAVEVHQRRRGRAARRPCPRPVRPRPRRRPPAAPGTPTTICSPSASTRARLSVPVRHPRTGAAGRLQRVDDPGAQRQGGDPRPADLAGDVDHDAPGRRRRCGGGGGDAAASRTGRRSPVGTAARAEGADATTGRDVSRPPARSAHQALDRQGGRDHSASTARCAEVQSRPGPAGSAAAGRAPSRPPTPAGRPAGGRAGPGHPPGPRPACLRPSARGARRTRPRTGGSGCPRGPGGSRRARRSAAPAVAVPPRRPVRWLTCVSA